MRQRLAVIGFSYLFGLLLASVFLHIAFASQFIIVFLTIVTFTSVFLLGKKPITLILIPLTVSFTLYTFSSMKLEADTKSITDGRIYSISGTITEKNEIGNDLAIYTVHSGIADFIVYTDSLDVSTGDSLSFSCSFSVLENSSPFKSADYYLSKGIRLCATVKSEIRTEKSVGFNLFSELYKYRESLSKEFSQRFTDNGSAMMKGIFLGDKSAFSGYESYCIKAAGVAHLTAVSGMHLSLIISILAAVFKLTKLSALPRTNTIAIILSILCFMAFFGFTASVTRSGIMLIIHYSAGLFYRKSACMNSLGTAILIICIANPLACHDAGFILSVVTTIGAGEIAPRVSKYLIGKYKRLPQNLIEAVCCGVFSALMGIPLSLIYFNMFSLYGVIVSVIALPVFSVALCLMLVYALSGGLFTAVLAPAHYCCKLLMDLFIFVAKLPFSHYQYTSTATSYVMLAGIITAIAAIVLVKKRKGIVALMTGTLTAVLYIGFIAIDKYTEGEYIKITPASDGENGYVLITAPDYCGAVITGGGDYACTGLLTLMLGENERQLDFLRITDNSTNSLKMASDMYGDICDTVILDNDDKALAERTGLFSDCYIYETHTFEKSSSKIVFDTDSTAIVVGNNAVNISEITKAENDKINICYGYQKTEPQISSQLFLIDKKQKKLGDSCTALYYTEANITVKQDGIVINKNHV